MKKIILASSSPRRKEILNMIGFDFEAVPSECEETTTKTEPCDIVCELSRQKAYDVFRRVPDAACKIIIGADTVVAYDGKIFGKPKSRPEAQRMLKTLSGNMHSVYTGICVLCNDRVVNTYQKTDVYFRNMSDSEIERYVDTSEPLDKAGAYGIQGKGAVFIEKIEGDYFNVVGLPVSLLYSILKEISEI